MENIISFGKINLFKAWNNPNGKKDCKMVITISLKRVGTNKTRFIASGDVWGPNGQYIIGGQCLDELAEVPELQSNDLFMKIYNLWKKYHLNDMHAGTPEQESALKTAIANGILPSLSSEYYTDHCNYLKSIGLYEVTLSDNTVYRYGHGWLYQPIPSEDLELIQELLEMK